MFDLARVCIIPFLLLVVANAAEPYERHSPEEMSYRACMVTIPMTATFCPPTVEPRSCPCTNPSCLATLVGCMNANAGNNDSQYLSIVEGCAQYMIPLSPSQIEGAKLNFTRNARNVSDIPGFNMTVPIDVPVILDSGMRILSLRAYQQFYGNLNNSLYYGSGIIGYWAFVFLLATISNWSKLLFPGLIKRLTGTLPNKYRKNISMAAIRRSKTKEKAFLKFFDFLIPSRLESIIIAGFVILTIIVCAVDMEYIEGDPVNGSRKLALSRYVADRTGIVVTTFMPLFILFAGRNNFLQWVTRWNFATFVAFHRWVGRVAVLLVIIHAACFTIALDSYFGAELAETFLRWGIAACVAGSVILLQGMLYLRRKWYEVFLFVHILMAVIFIAGAWIHVVDMGYINMVYATVGVWVFDRAVRLGRLFWFGCPESQVILLADETLKVIVPKPKYWSSIPGGHAFIHFLRPTCFWQSHPFTFTESSENGKSIILYCKVKGGVTHSLNRYLITHPGKTTRIRVALEGPYGEATAAKNYDKAVFIAGGNGIPGIYSEIFDLAKRASPHSRKVLKLTWIIREYRSLYWFYEELIALKNTNIEATIYVTNPSSRTNIEDFYKRIPHITRGSSSMGSSEDIQEDNTKIEEMSDNKSINKYFEKKNDVLTEDEEIKSKDTIIETVKAELSHIVFKEGRPSMEILTQQEVDESPGSIAFITCGHPMMVDDLRYSVAQTLDKSNGKRVEFFEQLQVWA